jgi:hypothetical protein
MFRKSTILSLAAAATLGVLAISTTSASAFHFGGGARGGGMHGGMHGGGMHFGAARVGAPHFAIRRNFALRRFGFPKLHPHHIHWGWWWHHHHHRHHWVWGAPVIIGGVSYAAATNYSSAPAPAYKTCNCLTKTYTQEGAVLFKDLCTNETAMNPPVQAPTTTGYEQPQTPVQQGYLQPQVQPGQ